MIWLSLCIPILGTIVLYIWFEHKMRMWAFLLPIICSITFIACFKAIVQKIQVSSTEYLGNLSVKAQYYEPWETWKMETCSRQVPDGTDSKGNTTYRTEYYDCSYCDYHSAKFCLVDGAGNEFSISEEKFNNLKQRWHSTPKFINLGRHINYSGGCGRDGNLYEVYWDNQILTSVATVKKHFYENRIKCTPSSFSYPKVTKAEKLMYGLYDYPEIDNYTQKAILGSEQFQWITKTDEDTAETKAQYLCGYYGPQKQMKLWVLLFKNKPSISADMQEALWVNGNKNEVVVCVGIDSLSKKLQWVKAFSWTPNKTMLVNIREDLMNCKTYDFKAFYPILNEDLQFFSRKHFKEFNYITVEPPAWCTFVTFIVVLIITVVCSYFSLKKKGS